MPTTLKRIVLGTALFATIAAAATVAWISQNDEPTAQPDDAAYTAFIADNPAFDCADGRNKGKDVSDSRNFTPCPNGAAHLRLNKGVLTIDWTSTPISLQGEAIFIDDPAADFAWNFAVSPQHPTTIGHDDGTSTTTSVRHVWHKRQLGLIPFLAFFRQTGGTWQVAINDGDKPFDTALDYELLFTWVDPKLPQVAASVPIDWNCVPNYAYTDWRC